MDIQRAKEIIASPKTIHVNYNGNSIWIDQVNEDGVTATVHIQGAHQEKQQVRLSDLSEVNH
ncbi:H-type small acid-soluble spore protein [Thermoactinomyces sp. DSM 45892]|uniref:H-type small acid-soluble spore protein n=1 Tax=Thermoactinomyces sp. DSM 45892 TaxID=1882753 RepID=UPI00089B477C|nr:H-type small acid-soluble spore protein [Thermoactinomyces sp. DSM 45892]SDY62930.1 small acid-soluble spore protein H (minor) [Thermoactinomyces sp. DSM 45892]